MKSYCHFGYTKHNQNYICIYTSAIVMHWYSDNMGKGQTLSLIYAGVLLKERQLKGKVKLQMALYKKLYLIVKCSYSLHVSPS